MRWHKFITFLSDGAAAWPLAACAQQQPMPVMGYLHSGPCEPIAKNLAAFCGELSESGCVESRH